LQQTCIHVQCDAMEFGMYQPNYVMWHTRRL